MSPQTRQKSGIALNNLLSLTLQKAFKPAELIRQYKGRTWG